MINVRKELIKAGLEFDASLAENPSYELLISKYEVLYCTRSSPLYSYEGTGRVKEIANSYPNIIYETAIKTAKIISQPHIRISLTLTVNGPVITSIDLKPEIGKEELALLALNRPIKGIAK